MDFTPPPVAVAKKGARMVLWIVAGVVVLVGLAAILGFISDPFGWRKKQVDGLRQTVASQGVQIGVNAATTKTSDETATAVRYIIEKGQKEVHYVQTLPGNATETDPVRRAGLCRTLRGVLNDPTVCDPKPDGKPASGVSDPQD